MGEFGNSSAAAGFPKPVATKVHRWGFSQAPSPDAVYDGENGIVPGAEDGGLACGGPNLPSGSGRLWPLVIIAGDGMTGSNFDSCVHSGRAACAKLLAGLGV